MSFKVNLHQASQLRGVGPDHGMTIGGPHQGHHLLVWQNGPPDSDNFGYEIVFITKQGWEHKPSQDSCSTEELLDTLSNQVSYSREEDIVLNIYSEVQRLHILIRNHVTEQLSSTERRYAHDRYGGYCTYPLASACPYKRAAQSSFA